MHRHRPTIAIAALVSAVFYVLLVLIAESNLATDIGIGYIAVLVTVAAVWDFTRNGRRSR